MSAAAPEEFGSKRERGIALAIVLVLVVLLVTAVYAFSRRAVINVHISRNHVAASEADAAARGGLRMAEAMIFMIRANEESSEGDDSGPSLSEAFGAAAFGGGGDIWKGLERYPFKLESGGELTLSIEEMSARLNLNALVPQEVTSGDDSDSSDDHSESLEYLVLVLRHIIDGMDEDLEGRSYDVRTLAENLIDYMDADDVSLGGGNEDTYYLRLEPPYRPRNGPFLTFDEIGMVEGIDPPLLEAMRDYLTIHPIGGTAGIDLNRAEPWVLPLVYAGPSGDRELLNDRTLRQILRSRKSGEKICTDAASDPMKCVSLTDVGIDEGSIFPETTLPVPVAVFRVVSSATVGRVTRRLEAVYDVRALEKPLLLSWRRLRGPA